jgi:hypothetical protein
MRRGGARWLVAIAIVLAVADPAAAQSSDGVLLDDIGPGWERTDCPGAAPGGSTSVCFTAAPESRFVEITPAFRAGRPARPRRPAGAAYAPARPPWPRPASTPPTASSSRPVAPTLHAGAGRHPSRRIGLIPTNRRPTAVAFLIDVGRASSGATGGRRR